MRTGQLVDADGACRRRADSQRTWSPSTREVVRRCVRLWVEARCVRSTTSTRRIGSWTRCGSRALTDGSSEQVEFRGYSDRRDDHVRVEFSRPRGLDGRRPRRRPSRSSMPPNPIVVVTFPLDDRARSGMRPRSRLSSEECDPDIGRGRRRSRLRCERSWSYPEAAARDRTPLRSGTDAATTDEIIDCRRR